MNIPYDAIKSGWHHIAVSWDGGTQIWVGIDGTFPPGYTSPSSDTLTSQPFTLPVAPTPDPTINTRIGGALRAT